MDVEQIAAIRARATPGPWTLSAERDDYGDPTIRILGHMHGLAESVDEIAMVRFADSDEDQANAELIVGLPGFLDALTTTQAQLAAAEARMVVLERVVDAARMVVDVRWDDIVDLPLCTLRDALAALDRAAGEGCEDRLPRANLPGTVDGEASG